MTVTTGARLLAEFLDKMSHLYKGCSFRAARRDRASDGLTHGAGLQAHSEPTLWNYVSLASLFLSISAAYSAKVGHKRNINDVDLKKNQLKIRITD